MSRRHGWIEPPAAAPRAKPAPAIVDAAHARAATQQRREQSRVPRHRLGRQCIHRVGQRLFQPLRPFGDAAVAAAVERRAEPQQDLGLALVPERVVQRERQDGDAGMRRARCAKPGAQGDRARADIGERALGGDPQHGAGRPSTASQVRRNWRRPAGRPAPRRTPPCAPAAHIGPARSGPSGHSRRGRGTACRRAGCRSSGPTRTGGWNRRSAARAGTCGKPVRDSRTRGTGGRHTSGDRARTAGTGRDRRARRRSTGVLRRRGSGPPEGGEAGHALSGAALEVLSRSRLSAAIQPDISTIGMPGPGCAAPPARYSPARSRERLPGLNAPRNLPWLARP